MAVKYFEGPFTFRLNDNGTGPHLLVQVCTERGWREYAGDSNVFKDRWNLWWRSGGLPSSHYRPLLPWQFVNRIPKGNSICRKDNLIRHLKCMKKIHGSIYDFSPTGYNLPSEYTKLAEECSRCEKDDRVWICKPVGQSQGRGIFLFRKLSDLSYDNAAVVQRYIENPLLVGGYKFDLRLYVCVPSYRPLAIYLYNEGLARFATEKFSLEQLDDPFRHLTNFSLNKLGPGYSEKKERVGSGCKWTFRRLRRYFEQSGYSDWLLWQRIACLATLTILSQAAGMTKSSNCFEFFGFDVLVDKNLKPWLLEVNLSPALSNDCDVDCVVKKPLLHDLFDLLGLPVCNTGLSLFNVWSYDDADVKDKGSSKCCPDLSIRRKPKPARESDTFVNFCSEKRPMLGQANPEVYPHSWARYNPFLTEKCARRDRGNANEEHPNNSSWDNGRDWATPCVREGGWIRICPLSCVEPRQSPAYAETLPARAPRIADKEIRNTVLSVQKYLKVARSIQRKNGRSSDEERNRFLQEALDLNTEVWLPEK